MGNSDTDTSHEEGNARSNKLISRSLSRERSASTRITSHLSCLAQPVAFTVEETSCLPYVKGTTHRIGQVLMKHDITLVYKPPLTIGAFLGNPKNKVKLENLGVHSISCEDC